MQVETEAVQMLEGEKFFKKALVLAGGFPPWPQAGRTHAPRTRTPEGLTISRYVPASFRVVNL